MGSYPHIHRLVHPLPGPYPLLPPPDLDKEGRVDNQRDTPPNTRLTVQPIRATSIRVQAEPATRPFVGRSSGPQRLRNRPSLTGRPSSTASDGRMSPTARPLPRWPTCYRQSPDGFERDREACRDFARTACAGCQWVRRPFPFSPYARCRRWRVPPPRRPEQAWMSPAFRVTAPAWPLPTCVRLQRPGIMLRTHSCVQVGADHVRGTLRLHRQVRRPRRLMPMLNATP